MCVHVCIQTHLLFPYQVECSPKQQFLHRKCFLIILAILHRVCVCEAEREEGGESERVRELNKFLKLIKEESVAVASMDVFLIM